MKIRDIFKSDNGNIIKTLINKMIMISKEYPEIFSEVLRLLEQKINERNLPLTEPTLLLKGQYVAVVGSNGLSKEYIYQIAKKYDISEDRLRIFSDYFEVKNSNVDDTLKSFQCVAIIMGPTPHSFNSVSKILSNKIIVEAKNSSGKRKITKSSLENSFAEIVTELQSLHKAPTL